MIRLQRYLAQAGAASRRGAEELIAAGRVRVDGAVVRRMGTLVGPESRVELDGRLLRGAERKRYVVLHKPVGVMTTMRDPEGRRTIASLLPAGSERIVPVGRLDYDTAGVLLLTNDGDLAHVLTHPRFGVEKTYRAIVRGRLDAAATAHLLAGLRLDDGPAAPAKIRVVATSRMRSELDVTIHEGRNRQVRRMLEALDRPVLALTRLRFGPISLGSLAIGALREITESELSALRVVASEAAQAQPEERPAAPIALARRRPLGAREIAQESPERARRRRFAAVGGARPWR